MKFKNIWAHMPARLFFLGILYLSTFAPAFADYDEACLNLLTRSGNHTAVFKQIRSAREPALSDALGFGRPMTNVEYEAFMDLLHGLPMMVRLRSIFVESDREIAFRTTKEMEALSEQLKQSDIVSIRYLPEALSKLGEIYKRACGVLSRPGCEVYDQYDGLSSKTSRPFTAVQEQALKWCMLHQFPSLEDLHGDLKASRKELAIVMLATTFGADDGAKLYLQFVGPFYDAAFENLSRIDKGGASH
ncbi:MAG: hypothetical protein ACXVA9_03695 [Bdellovibrionales bacterium]